MGMYLKYEGVEGPITASDYKGWIEIDSFEFEVKRGEYVMLGNGTNKATSITGAKMTKKADGATTALMREAFRGAVREDARVRFVTGGELVDPYLEFDFDRVVLAYYAIETVNGAPVETFVMEYERLRSTYTPRDATGKLDAQIPAGYDLKAGTPL